MAIIPGGMPIEGCICPTAVDDVHAVTDERFNRGGWRTVADLAGRDNITANRRTVGMLVNVLGDHIYELGPGLTNTDWTVFETGGGGSIAHMSLTARGIINGASTSPVSILSGITGTIDKIQVSVAAGNEGTGNVHFDLTVGGQVVMQSENSDLSLADDYIETIGKEVTGETLDVVFTGITGSAHFIVYYSVD